MLTVVIFALSFTLIELLRFFQVYYTALFTSSLSNENFDYPSFKYVILFSREFFLLYVQGVGGGWVERAKVC